MSERWWAPWGEPIAAYAILIRLMADGRISGAEFEVLFGQHYQDDTTDWPIEVLDVLEQVYFDLQDFRGGRPARGQAKGLDEVELRSRAVAAFERLAAAGSIGSVLGETGSVVVGG
jgi:hypothetical protein